MLCVHACPLIFDFMKGSCVNRPEALNNITLFFVLVLLAGVENMEENNYFTANIHQKRKLQELGHQLPSKKQKRSYENDAVMFNGDNRAMFKGDNLVMGSRVICGDDRLEQLCKADKLTYEILDKEFCPYQFRLVNVNIDGADMGLEGLQVRPLFVPDVIGCLFIVKRSISNCMTVHVLLL